MSEETIDHHSIDHAQEFAVWIERNRCGVLRLKGSDRIDLLHRLTTNDCTVIQPGKGVTTVLLNEKARIIDVVTVVDNGDHALVLTSEGTPSDIIAWLRKYIIMDDVKAADVSNDLASFDVIGPRSAAIVKDLVNVDVLALGRAEWMSTPDAELFIVRLPSQSRSIYRLLGPVESIHAIIASLRDRADEIPQLSDVEDEHLRILAGEGRIGHEWSADHNPLEAGLLHLTSFTKGCYIGQEVVARLDSYNKVKQRVMGLKGDAVIAQGDVIHADGAAIGAITSVAPYRVDGMTVALGYVRGEHAHENTIVHVQNDGSLHPFTLLLPPLGP